MHKSFQKVVGEFCYYGVCVKSLLQYVKDKSSLFSPFWEFSS